MSTVFYRWGAGRDESRVKFDGTHISVFDMKRQVMLDNNLGNGKDFDLVVVENGEELRDDNHQIARSSSLVVRRRPAVMKGRGTAQNYIVGTDASMSLTGEHRIEAHARQAMKDRMNRGALGAGGTYGSLSKRFDGKEEKKEDAPKVTTGDADEDARIQAMLQQQTDTWEEMQENMSTMPGFNTGANRRPLGRPSGPGGGGGPPGKFDYSVAPDKEPPQGYICYRCGQKGHWIQNCPKNDDPGAQDGKRYVRVTGIPRSFLQTVDSPLTGEGSSGGAMLTADGGFVRAVPDARAWEKQAAVKTRKDDTDGDDKGGLDPELTCPLCKKLFAEAVRVPCCQTAYCEDCIQTYLLEHDFECPACESKIASLDKLSADDELRERARAFRDKQAEVKKEAGEDGDAKGDKESAAADGSNAGVAGDDVSGKNPFSGPMPDLNTMAEYLQAMLATLRNPLVPPHTKAQLRAHVKMTNANLLQMQMMAAQGMLVGMGAMGGMGGMPGMGGMGAMGHMGNMGGMMGGNGNAMGQVPNMGGNSMSGNGGMGGGNGMAGNGMGNGGHMGGSPQRGGMPGRGGFRGGFRGRGGGFRGGHGGGPPRGPKRPADEAAGGMEKMQRVA